MNLLYDLRGFRYDTLIAGLPPVGLGVGCGPLAVRVGRPEDRVAPSQGLVAFKGGVMRADQTQLLSTNFNARIQYLFHSRLDRGQKVKRSVRCEACDITLNSELQAKQHYKGKFHQRKLRQQTQQPIAAADTSPDDTQCAEKPGGLKRTADQSDEDSSGHVAKLIRNETDSGSKNSNPNDCATVTTASITVTSEVSSSLVAENGDRKDAIKTEVPIVSDACEKINELELSIRVKNSQKSAAINVVPRPRSLPFAGFGQFHPGVLPRGVFLSPHNLLTCHSIPFQPSSVIPWRGPWVHPTLSQPNVQPQSVSFNVCGPQNSTGCIVSGFASQRVPSNPAPEVNVTSGLPLPLAFLQQATPTQTTPLRGSIGVKTDEEFGRAHDLTAIALANQMSGIARSSWRHDPAQLRQPVGVVCNKDLERLDPVSRAVYGNLLGHFTAKRTRCRSGRLR